MFSLRREYTHDIADSQLVNVNTLDLPNLLVYNHLMWEYTGAIVTPEYFTPMMYIKYLRDHLDKIEFINSHAVYALVNIPMVKVIREPTMADLQREIAELRAQVADLQADGFEMIHTHEYPSWSTYDEFKQLPGYKYFEAAENYKSYATKPDFKYGMKYNASHEITQISHNLDYMPNLYIGYDAVHDCADMWKYDIEANPLLQVDENYYKKYTELNKKELQIIFSGNIQYQFMYDIITLPLYEYINQYINGFVLHNMQQFINHDSYVLIHHDKQTTKIELYTNKKNNVEYWNHKPLIRFPKLKQIIIYK